VRRAQLVGLPGLETNGERVRFCHCFGVGSNGLLEGPTSLWSCGILSIAGVSVVDSGCVLTTGPTGLSSCCGMHVGPKDLWHLRTR
jgi:hypothetical protein